MRDAADATGTALMAIVSKPSIRRNTMPLLLGGMAPKQSWQTKLAAMTMFQSLAERFPVAVAASLPEIVPAMTLIVNDAKPQVKVRAWLWKELCLLVMKGSAARSVPA